MGWRLKETSWIGRWKDGIGRQLPPERTSSGWAANAGEAVRKGLVIALQNDNKLKWALTAFPNVRFLRYQINFNLIEEQLLSAFPLPKPPRSIQSLLHLETARSLAVVS